MINRVLNFFNETNLPPLEEILLLISKQKNICYTGTSVEDSSVLYLSRNLNFSPLKRVTIYFAINNSQMMISNNKEVLHILYEEEEVNKIKAVLIEKFSHH